jgi:hypothetical protein
LGWKDEIETILRVNIVAIGLLARDQIEILVQKLVYQKIYTLIMKKPFARHVGAIWP